MILEIQRQIGIDKILGVTKSVSEQNGEFVLHIKDSYDYRMRSDTRDQIIDLIRKLYLMNHSKVLPFYGVVIYASWLNLLETKESKWVCN